MEDVPEVAAGHGIGSLSGDPPGRRWVTTGYVYQDDDGNWWAAVVVGDDPNFTQELQVDEVARRLG